jgi:lipopolysaccharide transport system permease protein
VLVLKPSRGWRGVDLRELWRFRDLVRALAIRDVKLRYRQTALGAVWVVVQPLVAAGIFAFVFGRVAQLPSEGVPYAVFAFAGLLGWNAFNSTVTKSSLSLVQQSAMVQKVYFPRLALPISVVPGAVLDFAVSLGLMAVLMATNNVTPSVNLLTLPAWLILMLMFGLGIGFMAGALMVSYRDVAQVLPVAVQMLLYISPVAYSLEAVPPDLQFLYSLNPLVGVLEGFRWSLLSTTDLQLERTAYSVGMAFAIVIVGVLVFRRLERRFADVV